MSCGRKIGPFPCCSVVQGDCLELMKQIPDGVVDCIVTSPPYNQLGSRIPQNPTGLWAKSDGGAQWIADLHDDGYPDDMDEWDYQVWQNTVFSEAARIAKPTASLFYNHQLRWRDGVLLHPVTWFRPKGWNLRQEIIWNRAGGMMMNARMFCRFDERILWFVRESWKWNQDSVGLGTVWDIPREQHKEHPVAFPEEIALRPILATTEDGDLVLDPFGGSGTSGMAAQKNGRHFLTFDKKPQYVEIARKRLEAIDAQPTLFEPKPEQMTLTQ